MVEVLGGGFDEGVHGHAAGLVGGESEADEAREGETGGVASGAGVWVDGVEVLLWLAVGRGEGEGEDGEEGEEFHLACG